LPQAWRRAGTSEGRISGVDAATGAFKWRQTTRGAVNTALAVVRDRFVAASDGGYAYCIDAASGKLMATIPGAGTLRAGAVCEGDHAVFASTEGYLFGLSVHDGRALWVVDEGRILSAGPVQFGTDFAYVLDGGRLAVRDISTGEYRWGRRLSAEAGRDLVTDGQMVFVALEDGSIVRSGGRLELELSRRRLAPGGPRC